MFVKMIFTHPQENIIRHENPENEVMKTVGNNGLHAHR